MDTVKIENGIRMVLDGLGILDRPGVEKTPRRVAMLYKEIFSGLEADFSKIITPIKGEGYDEMVLVKGISFYSICEHHLLPFVGDASIAYIPNRGQIVGISKLARALEVLASRPQIQERLTTDLVELISESIHPLGAMVVIKAEHLCMSMRGVKKSHAQVITSAVRGAFRNNETTRSEMLELLR